MLNQRLKASQMVTEKIHALETAIDDALIKAAELNSTIPEAQRHANVSPVSTQAAFQLAGESMTALHKARASMVASHNAFAELQGELGLTPYAGGSLWKLATGEKKKDEALSVFEEAA